MSRLIVFAKLAALFGLVVLVSSTYFLRREVLDLAHLQFTAELAQAEHQLTQLHESHDDRVAHYEAELKNYELQKQHYDTMLELYRTDYFSYAQRLEDDFVPPSLPYAPVAPQAPEVAEELFAYNTEFRARKLQYFTSVRSLNVVSWIAAISLVGGLCILILFDEKGPRWLYFAALGMSFTFLIGPAFHSMLTGAVGLMPGPPGF